MIFRKIKKTYRKYFREKKIIKKEKLKDKSLEILFFIQYQSVSRCVSTMNIARNIEEYTVSTTMRLLSRR